MADLLSEILIPFFGVALMMMVWSWLYRESRWYHFAESTTVAVSVGNAIVVGLNTLNRMAQPVLTGSIAPAIAIIIGLLLFARFTSGYKWLSLYPMGMIMGIGTGIFLSAYITASIVKQFQATVPLFTTGNINDVITGIFIVLVMMYFLYTLTGTAEKVTTGIGRIGRMILMLAIGALFGQAAFTRLSRIVAIIQDVLIIRPDAAKVAVAISLLFVFGDAVMSKYRSLTQPAAESS
jgi:hypothetical protein